MNSQLNVILSLEPIPGTLVCLMGVSRVQGWNCVQKEGEPVWRVHITYRTSGPMPWVTRALPRNEVGEEEFVFGATYRCLLSDWAAEEILEPKGATKVHSKQNRAQRHAWDLSVYVCSCLLMSVRTMFIMWQNTKKPQEQVKLPRVHIWHMQMHTLAASQDSRGWGRRIMNSQLNWATEQDPWIKRRQNQKNECVSLWHSFSWEINNKQDTVS